MLSKECFQEKHKNFTIFISAGGRSTIFLHFRMSNFYGMAFSDSADPEKSFSVLPTFERPSPERVPAK